MRALQKLSRCVAEASMGHSVTQTHTQDRGAGTKSRDAKTQGRRRAGAMVKWSAARMNPFNKGVAYGMYLHGASYATIAGKVRTVVAERTCFMCQVGI